MLKFDGFEECLLGVVTQAGGQPLLCYDREKMLEVLRVDMDRQEAEEYFEFNVVGSFVGPETPLILERLTMEEVERDYGSDD